MVWDGLGFFGTDHMKLGRLQGRPVTFFTFLTSPKSVILSTLGLAVALILIIGEVEKLNTQKS